MKILFPFSHLLKLLNSPHMTFEVFFTSILLPAGVTTLGKTFVKIYLRKKQKNIKKGKKYKLQRNVFKNATSQPEISLQCWSTRSTL